MEEEQKMFEVESDKMVYELYGFLWEGVKVAGG